jgi:formylglycine-generating enzyme required for sulfatase activity
MNVLAILLLCVAVLPTHAQFVAGNRDGAGKDESPQEIVWATIDGGKFRMGIDSGYGNERPVHEVAIKTFQMTKTLVTVEQYEACVAKKRCTPPAAADSHYPGHCNWGVRGRRRHPVNCVSWKQANDFADFAGARLPTESEWEYAAKSRGLDRAFPWGNEPPDCGKAVLRDRAGDGCGRGATMPVCSKRAGNTAQGLCDMAGNVKEYVQDLYQDSYSSAPADGSAFEASGDCRVARGGSFMSEHSGFLRTDFRAFSCDRDRVTGSVGFRLARSGR